MQKQEKIEKLEKKIEELESKLKNQEETILFNDANLKVNYFVPVFILITYLFMKINGDFNIFGFEITTIKATTFIGLISIIMYYKELNFATKYFAKKILKIRG